MAKNQRTLEVKLKGNDLVFKAPNIKRFTRYTTKLIRDEQSVGERELVQTSCSSHDLDEIQSILNKTPAAVKKIANAIVEMSVGDVEVDVVDDEEIVLKGENVDCRFGGPDMEQWEKFQSDMRDPNKRPFEVIIKLVYTLAGDDKEEISNLITQYPGTVLALYECVSQVAGSDVEIHVKKA